MLRKLAQTCARRKKRVSKYLQEETVFGSIKLKFLHKNSPVYSWIYYYTFDINKKNLFFQSFKVEYTLLIL